MRIRIKHIDTIQGIEYKHGLNRYRVEFESGVASGQAPLYSQATPDCLLPGSQISVETSQNKVVDFHVLSNLNQLFIGRLTPLANSYDYEVVGRVAVLYDDIFDVDVEPGLCSFTVAFEEIGPTKVVKGDWVTFKVLGLELWDEHF